MKIKKGDGLVLFNGTRAIVNGPVFKMNSVDPDYYCVPVDMGDFQMPVDIRGVVEVWRDGEMIGGKVNVEQASAQAKSYTLTVKPKPDDLLMLPLFRGLQK